jgi:SAM-dependent MidA family methyltransferase
MLETPLQHLVIERIQREGPITFAEYMKMALYEPELGYYMSGRTKVGWEGDFYTSTDVADFFAHCMGQQLLHMWEELGQPTPFVVLEQGAGRAHLAQGVRIWAEKNAPKLAQALDYQTEDLRAGQDAIQQNMADLHPQVLLSNELVDAFPVHVVEAQQKTLYEVYINEQGAKLYEELGPPCSAEVAGYLDSFNVPWRDYEDGWRAEVNLDAQRWMRRSAQLLQTTATPKRGGFVLVIDYGEKSDALYTPQRRRGTLACYYKHQINDQPLLRTGQQDITAHVNFSALITEGSRYGLHEQTYTTQGEWLTELGIHEELAKIRERDFSIIDRDRASNEGQIALLKWYNLRQRVSVLTDPNGMGYFKVLILQS